MSAACPWDHMVLNFIEEELILLFLVGDFETEVQGKEIKPRGLSLVGPSVKTAAQTPGRLPTRP